MQQPYENFDTIDIQLIGGLTADMVDDLAEQLRHITPDVRSGLHYRSGIVNSLDLYFGAAIAIYIGKAFTDAFLKELGAQSAKGLTNALASVFAKAKSKNKRLMTAEEHRAAARELELAEAEHREPDRSILDALGRPVPVLSITVVVDTQANPRFVFPYELGDAALADAISQLPASVPSALSKRVEAAMQEVKSDDPLGPGDVYVYRLEHAQWIDAKAELKAQLDAMRQRKD